VKVLSKIVLYFFVSIIFSLSNIFPQNSEADKVLGFLSSKAEYSDCFYELSFPNFKIKDFSDYIGMFISEEDLQDTIHLLVKLLDDQLRRGHINSDNLLGTYGATNLSYVQKLITKQDDKVIVMGDIHGGCHSLCRNILTWMETGLLDRDFVLSENTYLIFTGDIADRGRYGVECWYFLMRLKINNPDKVFIMKGNHETYGMALTYGFFYELAKKYNPGYVVQDDYVIDAAIDDVLSVFNSKGLNKEFDKIFKLLPQALYVGNQEDGFIQFCHGGIPIPSVSEIDDDKGSKVLRVKQNYEKFISLKEDLNDLLDQDSSLGVIFKQTVDVQDFYWGDFGIGSEISFGERGVYDSAFKVGAGCALDIMQNIYGLDVKAIFRGHEHMFWGVTFIDKSGISVDWGKDFFEGRIYQTTREVFTKPVYTFMSCPETGLDFDGFGVLTIQKGFENWILQANTRSLSGERNGKFVHSSREEGELIFSHEQYAQDKLEMKRNLNLCEEEDIFKMFEGIEVKYICNGW